MNEHRPPAVAGLFYPASSHLLAAQVETMLVSVQPTAGHPKALVVPHAGYLYSGPVAASAYALLRPWRDRIRRVVLLGPVHHVPVRGLATTSKSAFDTPLGSVPVDDTAIAALADLPQVTVSDAAHAQEHALEVQLPFLQVVLGNFSLVPLAVGDASTEEVAAVLDRLWGGEETLVVVSTDLSHYLPYREAQRLDRHTVADILQLVPLRSHEQACGATPINGLLAVARHRGLEARLIDLRNSGDTAGDKSRVVGYAAFLFEDPGDG